MHEDLDAELRLLVREGLLRQEEVEALRAKVLAAGGSPVAWMEREGRLSPAQVQQLLKALVPNGATLPLPPDPEDSLPRPPMTHGGHTWPFQDWDRYEPIRFLGEGGMGVVWLARKRDLSGSIEVAIKLVRANDPRQLKLSVEEGRALSKVKHDRVCQVHEVGEKDGYAFIAMQFVKGRTLEKLEWVLTAREMAGLIRDIARGVQVAHDEGVIHRDIKPSNILVMEIKSEGLKPYLVDFGVARTWQSASTTSRYVVGTPHYMSPEQAEGEVATLDHRADVYGLGATLYSLLTGQPPFDGKDTEEVLARVRSQEPKDPRQLKPAASEDLAAIALKCLSKKRADRYPSASALADDLERYLSRDPVRAHRGAWYRLKRRSQKYAVPLVLGLAAAAALVGVVTTRVQAAAQVQLERQLTEQVEQIEAEARRSALSPPHDLRGDREDLRRHIAALDGIIAANGERATGPGEYARGKAFLALGDDARARQALEAAWGHGFQEPRVAYALVIVLGREYLDKLAEAQRQSDLEQRKLAVAAVQRHYQGQLLSLLGGSRGVEGVPSEYLKALIAFYERRHGDALALLDHVGETRAWVFEIAQLRGDILRARAFERWESGDTAGQQQDFEAALAAYRQAGEIARSLPSLHAARARLELFALIADLFGHGSEVLVHYRRGLEAIEPMAKLAPEDPESPLLQAQFHRLLADYRSSHGGDADAPLGDALRAAQLALKRAPSSTAARVELAQVYGLKGLVAINRSQDAQPELRLAASQLEGVPAADRDVDFYLIQGRVFAHWADAEDRQHLDSAGHRTGAIQALTAATKLDDQYPRAWAGLANAFRGRAIAPRAPDPRRDLEEGLRAAEKALALAPGYLPSYYLLGQLGRELAQPDRTAGEDPTPVLEVALHHLERGRQLNPAYQPLINLQGQVQLDLAQADWDWGRDPFPRLKVANETLQSAGPGFQQAAINLAEATAREARYLADLGKDPTAANRKALELFERAARLANENPLAQSGRGLALIVQAQYELEQNTDPQPRLVDARAAAEAAAQGVEKDEDFWRVAGSAQWLEARWRAIHGDRRLEGYEHAADTYERGLNSSPDDFELLREYALVCLDWAERAPASNALERADRLTQRMRQLRPKQPEARAFRAYVEGLVGKRSGSNGVLERARGDLDAALKENPNLGEAWKRRRAELGPP